MNRCKITVLKRTFFPELSEAYAPFIDVPCNLLEEGQVYYTGGMFGDEIPDGFCRHAWDAIKPYAAVYACGGKLYGQDFNIACCNDGVRPVYFKLETAEEA